jgi:hypothetical protein
MHESQVRPQFNGRKLVTQQPNRRHLDSRSSFRETASINLDRISSAPFRLSQMALLFVLAAGLFLISGCGSLNYKSLGTANSQALSDISCGTQSLTGAQSKTCSISLSAPALTLTTVKLSSTNPALKVPAEAKIAVGQSSANFDAITAGVRQTAMVTITASYSGVTKSAALTLYPAGTGSGSQTPTQHKVQLNWNAPAGLSVTVAGYNVYRATAGVSSYARLNPSIDTATAYLDTGVQGGLTYDYVVRTVDNSGIESGPSNATEVTIP